MFGRMWRAMRLDRSLYDEVEAGELYDRESWLVVILIAALNGLIGAIAMGVAGSQSGQAGASGIATFVGLIVSTLIGFLLTVLVIWFAGKLLGGRGSFSELRRALAYAYSPSILAAVPCVNFIVVFWVLATSFVATRQTHDISNGRTLAVIILAGVAQFIILGMLSLLGLSGGMLVGGLLGS